MVIAAEIPIQQEGIIRSVLRALELLSGHHDAVTLRLSIRRDDTTAFNPCEAIQALQLAHKVVYLPFFDNADLPDVIGNADVWLETTDGSAPSANCLRAMQSGVVICAPPALPVAANCFWPVGDFEDAEDLAARLASLVTSDARMAALKAGARRYVREHLPFSCAPARYVSPIQERLVHGWYTNEHFVLFVTASRPDDHGHHALTKRWLESIRSLGYRIICVNYDHGPTVSNDLFGDQVDHYFSVPAASALAKAHHTGHDVHVDDRCGSELTLKVQEICNTYSVGICFVHGEYLSRVLDRMPKRIRRVVAIDNTSLTADGERTVRARADAILSDDDGELAQALAPCYGVPDDAQRHFLNYHDVTMKYLSRFVGSFAGQVMLEVGPDDHLALARTVLANGAERVIGVQTTERTYDDLPDGLQFAMVSPTRWDAVEDESIDVVYGVGVLEHITHCDEVVDEIARVLKPGGRVFLQGCPMWGSSHGHHVVVFDSVAGDIKYDFMRPDRNPLQPWQHLALTKTQIRDQLLEKHVPERDADAILAMVFENGIGSNRKMPGDIIAAFRRRLHTDAVRYLDAGEKNQHYRAAAQRYDQKELLTDALMIYAEKPARKPASSDSDRPLVSVVVPLTRLAPIVRRALESIATQTYTDLEVLLVGGDVPDSCLAVAKEYVGIDARFHLVSTVRTPAGDHVFPYDANAPLECRAIETFVLNRHLPGSPLIESGAIEELREAP